MDGDTGERVISLIRAVLYTLTKNCHVDVVIYKAVI